MVRTHPETGRQGIYVNSAFTTRICGMNRTKADQPLIFFSGTWNTLIFNAGIAGRPIPLQCGITAVYSIMLPGTIFRKYDMVIE
ncbi:MAG: hypothetical protein VCA12_00350 [Pseudomonadales bacterium]